jgi:lysophospholipase L1-like esterase
MPFQAMLKVLTTSISTWLLKLLLVVVSLSLSLAALEAGLRVIGGVYSINTVFCKDSILRRVMRPHARAFFAGVWGNVEVKANAHGYRDAEWSTKNARTRVMLLGDSFGWGWGVAFEHTLSRLVEQSSDLSVFNLAIPGDGPTDYYTRYVVYRPLLKPDLVVLLVYVNDFFLEGTPELTTRRRMAQALDTHVPYAPQCLAFPDPSTLSGVIKDSRLFGLVTGVRVSHGFTLARFDSAQRRQALLREGYTQDLRHLTNDALQTKPAFAVLAELLGRLTTDAVPVLVAYIPPLYALSEDLRLEITSALGPSAAHELKPYLIESRLRELSTEFRVQFVSFSDTFRDRPNQFYFESDGHLNDAGHSVVARILQSHIRRTLAASGHALSE